MQGGCVTDNKQVIFGVVLTLLSAGVVFQFSSPLYSIPLLFVISGYWIYSLFKMKKGIEIQTKMMFSDTCQNIKQQVLDTNREASLFSSTQASSISDELGSVQRIISSAVEGLSTGFQGMESRSEERRVGKECRL